MTGFDPSMAVQDGSVSEPIDTIVYCTGTFLFPYTNRAACRELLGKPPAAGPCAAASSVSPAVKTALS